jgi:transmembrane sensor
VNDEAAPTHTRRVTAGSRPRPLRRRLPVGAVFGALAAAAALAVWLPGRNRRPAPVAQRASLTETNRLSQTVDTDAHGASTLQFSDGSLVTFRPGSAGRMLRLTEARVDLLLDHGRVDAHVIHAEATLWLIHAGPFEVRVTGTRFSVMWSAPRLEVEVYEGEVKVAQAGVGGGAVGSAVALRAGHRLTAGYGLMHTEELSPRQAMDESAGDRSLGAVGELPAPAPAGGAAPAALEPPSTVPASPAALSPVGARDGEWVAMAQRGAYAQAYATASHVGWRSLCGRLDARRLLLLGDVARYASASDEARRAFESLVTRFPDDRLAADAEFSLGRLAFEAGQTSAATRWFERYIADWPRAPLAEQALGRLVECALRGDDAGAARRAAHAYLQRAPQGPHAELARDVLKRSVDESP